MDRSDVPAGQDDSIQGRRPAPGPRRRLAWTGAGAAALLLLLLLLAWAGPLLTDWTARRGDLAALSAARLGRSVTLEGPVRLALLPVPTLEAAGATIGGEDEDIVLGARALRIRLDLGALLTGRIEPREIVLIGAELRLPWPPGPLAAAPWPGDWTARLDIRIEESSVRIGGLTLSGLAGRVIAGGGQGFRADLGFLWGQEQGRIAARAAPALPGLHAPLDLDLELSLPSARLRLRGVLPAEGGFAGEADLWAENLARFLPTAPIRASGFGRLSVGAEAMALERLTLDLGGAPATGSATFLLGPAPRLSLALDAARLDLDPWIAAIEQASAPGLSSVSLSLSAEAASLRGMPLRRLRAEATLDGGRLLLPGLSVLLPGDALLTASGAGERGRAEIAGRIVTADLRSLVAAAGAPEPVLAALPPAALRWAGLDWRAVVDAAQVALPEIAGRIDGAAVSGAATLRFGPRPRLGLGLAFDRLDLGLYRPRGLGAGDALALAAGFDADLRLSAERVADGTLVLERATLDAALEGGRLLLRRAAASLAGAQATLSGQVLPAERPGGPLRIAELAVELAAAAAAPPLEALLRAAGTPRILPPIAAAPVSLRLAGGGPADALALTLSGEIEALRLEASPRIDLVSGTVAGRLTLRHPGARRLAALLTGEEGWDWLGEGSFSLIGSGTLAAERASLDPFDLVAGETRLSGALSLARGARPALSARIAAEVLPLPAPPLSGAAPLPLAWLFWGEADAEVAAERLLLRGGPEFSAVSARLSLAPGVFRIGPATARLSGGALSGGAALTVEGWLPRLSVSARLAGAALTGPLADLPLDLSAGQFDVAADLTATGFSPAALVGTLSGDVDLVARNGVLVGFDLPAAALAASLADPAEAAGGVGAALSAGATAFERLALVARLAGGRIALLSGDVLAEGGISARATGGADLSRRLLDLSVEASGGDLAGLGLRLSGAAEAPQRAIRLPEALRARIGRP
ncbi:MAG: AsmA family protein [Acetobacteraceae bacterium]|nr:AsmA family protein [Acetobacteraceae bacterium]